MDPRPGDGRLITDYIIIQKIISESIRCPLDSVTIDSTFADLGITSLDAVNIAFAIEGEFEIEIPDEAISKISDVRGIISAMEAIA